jgi:Tol biopolymer transport system component
MSEEKGKSGPFVKILVAIIPVIGSVIVAIVSNLDKIADFITPATEAPSNTQEIITTDVVAHSDETTLLTQEYIDPAEDVSTESPIPPASPSTPLTGGIGKIVFVSRRDGENEIYFMDVAVDDQGDLVASEPIKLTNNNVADTYPAWSPDGSKIAFQSKLDGDYDIYVMDFNSRQITPLTSNTVFDSSPAWSPDGRLIAFHSNSDGDRDIYLMDEKGNIQKNLTVNENMEDYSPTWSPNGTKIAFYSNRDYTNEIYVMNVDGNNAQRLTYNGGENPAWSPDGTKIAFASCEDELDDIKKKCDIYTIEADGSKSPVCLVCDKSFSDMRPTWSPDGTKITFYSNRRGTWDIYVMDADGSNIESLTNHPEWDGIPSWQP